MWQPCWAFRCCYESLKLLKSFFRSESVPPECHCGWDTAVNFSSSLPLTLSATTPPSGVESFLPKSPRSKGRGGEKPSQEVDFDPSWPRPGHLCTRPVVIYSALSLPSGNPALTHEGLIQLEKKKKHQNSSIQT